MVYVSFSLLWTGAHRLERWLMEKSIYYHVWYVSSNMSYVWFSVTAAIDQYASIGFVWNLCISWQVELSLLLCEGGAATRLNISRWDLYSICWGSWTNIWSLFQEEYEDWVGCKFASNTLRNSWKGCLVTTFVGDWNHSLILYARINGHWLLWRNTDLLSCTKVFSELTRSSFHDTWRTRS